MLKKSQINKYSDIFDSMKIFGSNKHSECKQAVSTNLEACKKFTSSNLRLIVNETKPLNPKS